MSDMLRLPGIGQQLAIGKNPGGEIVLQIGRTGIGLTPANAIKTAINLLKLAGVNVKLHENNILTPG